MRIPSLIYSAEISICPFEVFQQKVVKQLHFVYQLIKCIGQLLASLWSKQEMPVSGQATKERPPLLSLASQIESPCKFAEPAEPMTPDRPINTLFSPKGGEVSACTTPPRRRPLFQAPNSPERASPSKSLPDFKRKQIEKTMRKLFQDPQDKGVKSPVKGLAKVEEEEAQVVVNGWSGLLEWESDSKNLDHPFEI